MGNPPTMTVYGGSRGLMRGFLWDPGTCWYITGQWLLTPASPLLALAFWLLLLLMLMLVMEAMVSGLDGCVLQHAGIPDCYRYVRQVALSSYWDGGGWGASGFRQAIHTVYILAVGPGPGSASQHLGHNQRYRLHTSHCDLPYWLYLCASHWYRFSCSFHIWPLGNADAGGAHFSICINL